MYIRKEYYNIYTVIEYIYMLYSVPIYRLYVYVIVLSSFFCKTNHDYKQSFNLIALVFLCSISVSLLIYKLYQNKNYTVLFPLHSQTGPGTKSVLKNI